jgi:GT2 family glycosyltransferase
MTQAYSEMSLDTSASQPLISVIVLNYNGAHWLERCLMSLRAQTIFAHLEVIVADNASPDKSDVLAADLMRGWPNGRIIQHGENLGYCAGNNRAAVHAHGRYLFFLNNDTWLEVDCLAKLLKSVEHMSAQAAAPQILAYENTEPDTPIASGFDCFGLASYAFPGRKDREVFIAGGCSYLINRDLFQKIGGFDEYFYMYADECDLSWRVWIAGGRIISAAEAYLHHRGGANVNPAGLENVVELRTSDSKRYYANRNGLLVVLKNSQHILLLTILMQLLLLAAEAMASLVLVRRWSFVHRAYFGALADCWRMRAHILKERQRIKSLRQRSDWWMLRFFRLKPGRMEELRLVRRFGKLSVNQG